MAKVLDVPANHLLAPIGERDQAKERTCMCCRRSFLSQHAGNRMYQYCSSRSGDFAYAGI